MHPTQFDETIPGHVLSSWTPQQGLSRPPNQTLYLQSHKLVFSICKSNMRRTSGASMFMTDGEPNGDTRAFAAK